MGETLARTTAGVCIFARDEARDIAEVSETVRAAAYTRDLGKRARNDWASVDHNVLLDRGALRFVPAVKEILATVGLV